MRKEKHFQNIYTFETIRRVGLKRRLAIKIRRTRRRLPKGSLEDISVADGSHLAPEEGQLDCFFVTKLVINLKLLKIPHLFTNMYAKCCLNFSRIVNSVFSRESRIKISPGKLVDSTSGSFWLKVIYSSRKTLTLKKYQHFSTRN